MLRNILVDHPLNDRFVPQLTVSSTDDFRFLEEMGAFNKEARTQCDILQAMAKKMEELYGALSEYLVFDKQKYTLEEFMGDVKTFKDQYKVRSDQSVTQSD